MKFIAFIFAVLCALPTQAQTTSDIPTKSLFFSLQEVREAERLAEKTLPAGSADIHLGAVMYYGKDDWTIWLQGQRWTPQTAQNDLHVTEVTPAHVQILWRDENGTERNITLKPNETYQIATGTTR